jgi:hypothetical protein
MADEKISLDGAAIAVAQREHSAQSRNVLKR